ncbi:hypothetical protein WICPIJ_009932 [Wickerhamomyces pijperi]|uniref:F-box domain-containing protein n=1 Tax=Wickerhamomyces pijperi TaxID=599730 RepID=A0A9P8PJ99_WICPI|nr:hypothetical protein WICPIJ_009932 [Wickerhamomyces pijperi]
MSDPPVLTETLHGQSNDHNRPVTLINLPLEIILKIFQTIDITRTDLLQLSLSCKYLRLITYKFLLYRSVKLTSSSSLLLFLRTINEMRLLLPSSPSLFHGGLLSLVKEIEFHCPTDQESDEYISNLMCDIIYSLPNLQHVSLCDITGSVKLPSKRYGYSQGGGFKLRKLTISARQFSVILLRPDLLLPFGKVEELEIERMVIDSKSFFIPENKAISEADDHDHFDSLSTTCVSLSNCSLARNCCEQMSLCFQNVSVLKLSNLTTYLDIEMFLTVELPKLSEFYLDLNSKCFSGYDSLEVQNINVGNINSNYGYYKSRFVPNFYLNYTKFSFIFDQLSEHQDKIKKLVFTNTSFTNVKPITTQEKDYTTANPDYDLVNDNCAKFLRSISNFDHLEFVMLKNYKLHQARSRDDWEKLLTPCFRAQGGDNSVVVKDKDSSLLYQRSTV